VSILHYLAESQSLAARPTTFRDALVLGIVSLSLVVKNSDLYVTRPDGTLAVWPIVSLSSPFAFGPGESGDAYFGVDQIGGWQAQAILIQPLPFDRATKVTAPSRKVEKRPSRVKLANDAAGRNGKFSGAVSNPLKVSPNHAPVALPR
jgi:hypothetical protein